MLPGGVCACLLHNGASGTICERVHRPEVLRRGPERVSGGKAKEWEAAAGGYHVLATAFGIRPQDSLLSCFEYLVGGYTENRTSSCTWSAAMPSGRNAYQDRPSR